MSNKRVFYNQKVTLSFIVYTQACLVKSLRINVDLNSNNIIRQIPADELMI